MINHELSIPVYDSSINGYKIYVIEYWLNENIHLEYHLTKNNDTWKINDIKTSIPFKFLRR